MRPEVFDALRAAVHAARKKQLKTVEQLTFHLVSEEGISPEVAAEAIDFWASWMQTYEAARR